MIQTIATLFFFGVYAINYFEPFAWAGIVMAIAAAVIAVMIAISLLKQA